MTKSRSVYLYFIYICPINLHFYQAPRSIALGFARYVLLVVAQLGKNPWWDQVQTNNYKVASEVRERLPHFGTDFSAINMT